MKDVQNKLKRAFSNKSLDERPGFGVVVLGTAGSGKTQLILKYLKENSSEYHSILWVNAHSAESFMLDFAKFYMDLGLSTSDDERFDTSPMSLTPQHSPVVRAVRGWLRAAEHRWLVVLDDLNITWGVRDVLPEGSNGTIITTTQDQYASEVLQCNHTVHLGAMEKQHATKLFLAAAFPKLPDPSEELIATIERICDRLGQLPLAIHVAASQVKRDPKIFDKVLDKTVQSHEAYQVTKRYMDRLNSSDCDSLLQAGGNELLDSPYPRRIHTAWDKTFELLQDDDLAEEGPSCVRLLTLIAFLRPTTVPYWLFERAYQGLKHDSDDLVSALPNWIRRLLSTGISNDRTLNGHPELANAWDDSRYRDAVNRLWRYGLVSIEKRDVTGRLKIHNLVRWRVQRACNKHEYLLFCSILLKLALRAAGLDEDKALPAMHLLADTYRDLGKWQEAERVLRQLISRRVAASSGVQHHPGTLHPLSRLVDILLQQGRRGDAERAIFDFVNKAHDWRQTIRALPSDLAVILRDSLFAQLMERPKATASREVLEFASPSVPIIVSQEQNPTESNHKVTDVDFLGVNPEDMKGNLFLEAKDFVHEQQRFWQQAIWDHDARTAPDLVSLFAIFALGSDFNIRQLCRLHIDEMTILYRDPLRGRTPLHWAAERGRVDELRLCLEKLKKLGKGFEVNSKDDYGATPLHLAAAKGWLDTVEALLLADADVVALDNSGSTPLHLAAANGRLNTVEALLQADADVVALDNSGSTPLQCVIMQQSQPTTEPCLSSQVQLRRVEQMLRVDMLSKCYGVPRSPSARSSKSAKATNVHGSKYAEQHNDAHLTKADHDRETSLAQKAQDSSSRPGVSPRRQDLDYTRDSGDVYGPSFHKEDRIPSAKPSVPRISTQPKDIDQQLPSQRSEKPTGTNAPCGASLDHVEDVANSGIPCLGHDRIQKSDTDGADHERDYGGNISKTNRGNADAGSSRGRHAEQSLADGLDIVEPSYSASNELKEMSDRKSVDARGINTGRSRRPGGGEDKESGSHDKQPQIYPDRAAQDRLKPEPFVGRRHSSSSMHKKNQQRDSENVASRGLRASYDQPRWLPGIDTTPNSCGKKSQEDDVGRLRPDMDHANSGKTKRSPVRNGSRERTRQLEHRTRPTAGSRFLSGVQRAFHWGGLGPRPKDR